MNFNIIVAVNSAGGIAFNGKLSWAGTAAGAEDMAYFKQMTVGDHTAVIMGRKTWESIPKRFRPLPGRINVVMSRDQVKYEGAFCANSFDAALDYCVQAGATKCFCIGGASIYAIALKSKWLRRVLVTVIAGKHLCDLYFPHYDQLKLVQTVSFGQINQYLEMATHEYESGYRSLCSRLLTAPVRQNRTGIPTRGVFHEVLKISLTTCTGVPIMPLITSKNTYFKGVFHELIWFLRGSTDTEYLRKHKIRIWDGNSTREYLDSRQLTHYEPGEVGPCFLASTKTLTSTGYKNIEDIVQGELLYTDIGNWKPVEAVHNTLYNGFIYVLKLKYHPLPVKMTPEHPILCRTYRIIDKMNGARNIMVVDAPEWIKAQDLTLKHLIGFKIETMEIIPKITLFTRGGHYTPVEYTKLLNSHDEWWMFGYFLGDGWIVEEPRKNGRVHGRIYFAINKAQDADVTLRIHKVLNIQICKDRDTPGCSVYKANHREYEHILRMFGKYAAGKKIPDWVHKAPKEYIRTFLDGYRTADGCFRKDGKHPSERYTTISYDIAMSVQRLYLKLDRLASVSFQKRGYQKEIRPGKMSHISDCYFIEVYIDKPRRNNYSYIDGDYAWYCISGIYHAHHQGPVYNFTITDDNTYTVENMSVHNCYGWQWRNFGAEYVPKSVTPATNYVSGPLTLYGENGMIKCNDGNTLMRKDLIENGIMELGRVHLRDDVQCDQIADALRLLRTDPWSRRILVSAWNPRQSREMALEPCHYSFQFHCECKQGEQSGNEPTPIILNCLVNMRSCDVGLGLPFNIASYALLTHMFCALTGMTPGTLSISMADCHLYTTHVDGVKQMLECTARPAPAFALSNKKLNAITVQTTIDEFIADLTLDDVILYGYEPNPTIKMDMAV